jgi:MFS family permease
MEQAAEAHEAAAAARAEAPRGQAGKRDSLWRDRDFMLLWGGQTVSEMGSSVTQLALPLTAVVLLKASTFEVALLTSAATAAFALIALPAGAIVDRHTKRGIMLACDAARVLIIGSVPLAWALGVLTMWQLYVVALAAGVATVFFDVSYQSYLPVLLKPENLMDGNGKLGATQAFAQFTGPGLGGGLVGAVGAATAMWADAISYVVSVASLFGIRTREQRVETPPEHRNLRAEIAEGLTFVVRHPILRKIVACTGTSNLFSSMCTAIDIVFLIRVLHVHPAYTGLVFAVSAIGGIAGGVFAGRLARRIGSARIIWFSVLVFGVPQFLPALAQPGWSVVLFPIGYASFFFCGVVYNVAQVSYRQAVTPPQLMGRMNAAVRWIVWGTMPLGAIIGGALGSTIGIRPTLWIGFVGSWAAGFFVYFSPLRKMRDIPTQLSGPPSYPARPVIRHGLDGAAAELHVRGQRHRAFQHARVHERLGQVAAQLPLVHVELLGVQRGGPAGAPVALEPVRRGHRMAARVLDKRHPEPAQQERPLRLVQRPRVVPEPVHVPVGGQLPLHRVDRRDVPRIVERQSAAD